MPLNLRLGGLEAGSNPAHARSRFSMMDVSETDKGWSMLLFPSLRDIHHI